MNSSSRGRSSGPEMPSSRKMSEQEPAFQNGHRRGPRYDKKLPVHDQIGEIQLTIANNQVTVVSGSTGCGKSTQIPLFVLDDFERSYPQKFCRILVAVPRRIAATTLAEYVANFRGVNFGEEIGYRIGMGDSKYSPASKIIYCTMGVLVHQLVRGNALQKFTHIFLDEVHERSEDVDFAMLLIKLALEKRDANVSKIIIMSATMDVGLFAGYFLNNDRSIAKTISVIGKDNNKVTEYYLEEFEVDFHRTPVWDLARPFLLNKLLDVVLGHIHDLDMYEAGRKLKGTVLIFLPGLEHIELMMDKMEEFTKSETVCNFIRWEKCPLHSLIPYAQQLAAFGRPKNYIRRIVLATNIAESSITVPDVEVVYDFCLTKRMVTDGETRLSFLQLQWASKSNCEQRKGRAGRVCSGKVYRMVPQYFYEGFEAHQTPEMELVPITTSLLRLKTMAKQLSPEGRKLSPAAVFSQALASQSSLKVEAAVFILKEKGALSLYNDDRLDGSDGDVTFLGQLCALLPLDLSLTRLIYFGYSLGLTDDTIIVASLISVRGIFSAAWQGNHATWISKRQNDDGLRSDCLVAFRIFREWAKLYRQGRFECNGDNSFISERTWCRQRSVLVSRLREVLNVVDEIRRRLSQQGLVQAYSFDFTAPFEAATDWILLMKIAIAGAFIPNYMRALPHVKVGETLEELDKAASESTLSIAGSNPKHCFVVSLAASNTPAKGAMYVDEVKKFVGDKLESDVTFKMFTRGSEIVVVFEPTVDDGPDGVSRYMEMLVRLTNVWTLERHPYPMTFSAIDPNSEEPIVAAYPKLKTPANAPLAALPWVALDVGRRGHRIPKAVLPNVEDTSAKHSLSITYVIDGCSFYAHFAEQSAAKDLLRAGIQYILKSPGSSSQPNDRRTATGRFVLARLTTDEYARAEVRSTSRNGIEVFFIDYGRLEKVPLTDVSLVSPPNHSQHCAMFWFTPALAVRCLLPRFLRYVGSWDQMLAMWPLDSQLICLISHQENDAVMLMDVRCKVSDQAEKSLIAEAKEHGLLEVNTGMANQVVPPVIIVQEIPTSKITSAVIPDNGRIQFKPPFSPYEVRGAGAWNWTHGLGRTRNINVHYDSVNAVVMLSRIPDPLNTVLICSGDVLVSRRSDGSGRSGTIVASDTTLMPHTPGIFALVSAVFAPVVEIRLDTDSHPVGFYCGLGRTTNGAVFERHDFLALTDGKLHESDVFTIDVVRDLLNRIPLLGSAAKDVKENSVRQQRDEVIRIRREELTKQILSLFRADRSVELNPLEKFKDNRLATARRWSCSIPEDLTNESFKDTITKERILHKLLMQVQTSLVDLDSVSSIPIDNTPITSELESLADLSEQRSEDNRSEISSYSDVIRSNIGTSVGTKNSDQPEADTSFEHCLSKQLTNGATDFAWTCREEADNHNGANSGAALVDFTHVESEVDTGDLSTRDNSGLHPASDVNIDSLFELLDIKKNAVEDRDSPANLCGSQESPEPSYLPNSAAGVIYASSYDRIMAELASVSIGPTEPAQLIGEEEERATDSMETETVTQNGDGKTSRSSSPDSTCSFSTASESSIISVVANPAYMARRDHWLNNKETTALNSTVKGVEVEQKTSHPNSNYGVVKFAGEPCEVLENDTKNSMANGGLLSAVLNGHPCEEPKTDPAPSTPTEETGHVSSLGKAEKETIYKVVVPVSDEFDSDLECGYFGA